MVGALEDRAQVREMITELQYEDAPLEPVSATQEDLGHLDESGHSHSDRFETMLDILQAVKAEKSPCWNERTPAACLQPLGPTSCFVVSPLPQH